MASKSVAVLDIRSSEVTLVVGARGVNHTIVFKASATEPYGGYQDGAFLDVQSLGNAVFRALASVEQICGEKIKTLTVGVPGEFTDVVAKEQAIGFSKNVRIGSRELNTLFESGKERRPDYRFMRVTGMVFTTADNRRVADPTGLVSTGLSGALSYFYCKEYFAKTLEEIFSSRNKFTLHFLPTQFAMASYLIPAETRDEYALFLDVGYLSSTVCVLLGNGVLAQETVWAGKGQIAVRLMEKFDLSYEAATYLLSKANLYLKREAKEMEFLFQGESYGVPVYDFLDEVKAGLDELCESVGGFLEAVSSTVLDNKPLYVSGEGLDGIRGALEHVSKRLSYVVEQVVPDLPYYNTPAYASRVALVDMACEDQRKSGLLYRLFNLFGG